jgi:3-methyl-2-oxobutanoate hydroxymethyltransferase
MSTTPQEQHKITTQFIRQKKQRHQAITMMTAYDYPTAQLVDEAGMDTILVGDSLGMGVLGYDTTLPVTMEDMLHHCRAVARGAHRALLIGDMPFLSYQVSVSEAVRNAGRFLQEAGMDAVKLEGGRERLDAVRAIVQAGIPVVGHIGLTPQSVHQLGGFRMQGNTAQDAQRLFEDAQLLQAAGCFGIVLESIPAQLAGYITEHIQIPTIGIGAGPHCDGQVLVLHDMLGIFDRFKPRFAKAYANLHGDILTALGQYKTEVESGAFPAPEHTAHMSGETWDQFLHQVGQ